jgi:hypothetical protein
MSKIYFEKKKGEEVKGELEGTEVEVMQGITLVILEIAEMFGRDPKEICTEIKDCIKFLESKEEIKARKEELGTIH